MKQYLINLSVLFSQAVNVIIFSGHPDQTVSARAHLSQHKRKWRIARKVINGIFFWQEDHCYTSYKADLIMARWIIENEGRS
jgi:hypothetical protein